MYLVTGLSGIFFYMDTYYINLSLFLAFATIIPDMQVLVMFIIPVRMKWLALLGHRPFGRILYPGRMEYPCIDSCGPSELFMLFYFTYAEKGLHCQADAPQICLQKSNPGQLLRRGPFRFISEKPGHLPRRGKAPLRRMRTHGTG